MAITELLKKPGYATGHFGKWHIGPETQPGTYGAGRAAWVLVAAVVMCDFLVQRREQ